MNNIAIHRKPHTVLRRLAVQLRTVFGDAPCLKLSVDGYNAQNNNLSNRLLSDYFQLAEASYADVTNTMLTVS